MEKLKYYINLLKTDQKAFRYQLWMVWNRYKINTIKWFFNTYARFFKKFLTVHSRPMYSKDIGTWSQPTSNNQPLIAIVLQGQIVADHNFTAETVRLYKKHYPESPIIVSTDTDSPHLEAIRKTGAHLVLSDRPAVRGIGNVNLQIISTLAGIKKAQELGAEYVYKTRCDQRMYAPNMNTFLYALIEKFPVTGGSQQKKRIVASSFSSLKFVPYFITDMFLFGHIDDMATYWSAELDTRTKPDNLIRTVQELNDARICESYLCSEFLKKVGHTPLWTLEDSWKAYAEHFCIVDKCTLDLFWYKYNFYMENQLKEYDGINNNTQLTFSDWLVLHTQKCSTPETDNFTLSLHDNIPKY